MAAVAAEPGRPPATIVGRDVLRPLLVRTNRHGLVFLAGHVAVLVLSGTWLWLALGSWRAIPALIIYGVAMAHLFALFHEATHRTAFRGRRTNRAIAWLTGLVVGLPPRYFRLEHTAHHLFTQDGDRDPELVPVPRDLTHYALFVIGVPYWWWAGRTLAAHTGGRFLGFESSFLPVSERRRIVREARAFTAIYTVAVVVSVATGSTLLLWFWLLPRLVGEPAMRIARLSEHAGRPLTADPMVGTRSLRVLAPLRILAWNMPFHAEHHASPSVPFHALPKLHVVLKANLPTGGGYLSAQVDIVRQIGRGRG
jgi:fatty acid desaturase